MRPETTRLAAEIDRQGIDLTELLPWETKVSLAKAIGVSDLEFDQVLRNLRRGRGLRTRRCFPKPDAPRKSRARPVVVPPEGDVWERLADAARRMDE